jgi:hypothetical protein
MPREIKVNEMSGVGTTMLKTREIVNYDPLTGQKYVRLVIDDSEYYKSSFERIEEPYHNWGSSGNFGIPGTPGTPSYPYKSGSSGEYGTSGSFMKEPSIINWELHQRTLPETKIETEIRKEFLPKKKISNNPVKIDKKNKPDKKKKEPKKIMDNALSLASSFVSLVLPINIVKQIIKRRKW